MAAALCAARGSGAHAASVAIVERAPALGGILNQCTHKGFGLTYFGEELTGIDYARRFARLVDTADIDVFTDTSAIDIGGDRTVAVSGATAGLLRLQAKAVILATGCRERPIGALPVAGTRPSGVFTAGSAQKMMNIGGYDIGNRFVILGSGDVGMIVARHLAQSGKEVIAVLEISQDCGGLPSNRINCLERYNIPLLTRTTVSKVHGAGRVCGVTVADLAQGGSRFIECDTLITSVGLVPERDLLDGLLSEGPLPDWLFLCGNACFVHDTADDTTFESERTGSLAADFALHGVRMPGANHGDRARSDSFSPAEALAHGGTAGLSESGEVVCCACPKSCRAVLTSGGWQGLCCGRDSPDIG
ncbi:MAG: NAD(P)/FAD-dependent oxidoreductase [Oscillospiraceae bacterium]|nr:NAD(P)/FAD-dependent oxidoreductase [Oscillospiraceae bacterium]